MQPQIGRRHLLQIGGFALAGAASSSLAHFSPQGRDDESGDRIRKAVGWEMIQEELSVEDKFRLVKDVGFEGVEINSRCIPTFAPTASSGYFSRTTARARPFASSKPSRRAYSPLGGGEGFS